MELHPCYNIGEKMGKLMEIGRKAVTKFLNLVVILILIALGCAFMIIDGVVLTNVINQLQTGSYADASFGVQVMFLFVTLSAFLIYFKEYVQSR
jgi:hypothetical protein